MKKAAIEKLNYFKWLKNSIETLEDSDEIN